MKIPHQYTAAEMERMMKLHDVLKGWRRRSDGGSDWKLKVSGGGGTVARIYPGSLAAWLVVLVLGILAELLGSRVLFGQSPPQSVPNEIGAAPVPAAVPYIDTHPFRRETSGGNRAGSTCGRPRARMPPRSISRFRRIASPMQIDSTLRLFYPQPRNTRTRSVSLAAAAD